MAESSLPNEQWRPIPGYEGSYEVSDQGRVRSLDRWVYHSADRRYYRRGKTLRPAPHPRTGYPLVKLKLDGAVRSSTTHALVMLAFVGPRPTGLDVCHENGNPADNRLGNLRYGTKSDNQLDRVRHGRHVEASKTECKWGHPFDELNTRYSTGRGGRLRRDCYTCRRERGRLRKR